jgi:hypothetical protein
VQHIQGSNNAAPNLVFTHQQEDKAGGPVVSHPKGILKYQAKTEFHFHSRLLL